MLKFMGLERRGSTAAVIVVEGEEADINELVVRLATGKLLSVPGAQPTLPAVTTKPTPAAVTPAPVATPAAATEKPKKEKAKAPAPPPVADEEEEEDDDEEGDDGFVLYPEAVAATKLREVLVALHGKGITTKAGMLAWCKAMQAKVPTLAKIPDLDERVDRAAVLVGAT